LKEPPDWIPGDWIPGISAPAAVHELNIPGSGLLDLIAVEPDGTLTFVECYLAANAERGGGTVRRRRSGRGRVRHPYKCPPAPLAAVLVLEWRFRGLGAEGPPQRGVDSQRRSVNRRNGASGAGRGGRGRFDGGEALGADRFGDPRDQDDSGRLRVGDLISIPIGGERALPKADVFVAAQGRLAAEMIASRILGTSPPDPYDGAGSCFLHSQARRWWKWAASSSLLEAWWSSATLRLPRSGSVGKSTGSASDSDDVSRRRRRSGHDQRRYRSWSIPNWSRTLPAVWSRRSSMVSGP
jgi:hypothetical protein